MSVVGVPKKFTFAKMISSGEQICFPDNQRIIKETHALKILPDKTRRVVVDANAFLNDTAPTFSGFVRKKTNFDFVRVLPSPSWIGVKLTNNPTNNDRRNTMYTLNSFKIAPVNGSQVCFGSYNELQVDISVVCENQESAVGLQKVVNDHMVSENSKKETNRVKENKASKAHNKKVQAQIDKLHTEFL